MKLDDLRAFCLSFPGATEDIQWGSDLLFRVGGKIFAGTNPDAGAEAGVTFKAPPVRIAELLEIEGVRRADYVGRYGWLTAERLNTLSPAELKSLLRQSYEQVAAKLPKSSRKPSHAPVPPGSLEKSEGRHPERSLERKRRTRSKDP
jgi:predicted DNA-binding protein (MmcQ/YjbR family)